jgi:hypothetical protein
MDEKFKQFKAFKPFKTSPGQLNLLYLARYRFPLTLGRSLHSFEPVLALEVAVGGGYDSSEGDSY